MKKILAIAIATAISAPAMADLTVGGSARYQADTGTNGEMSATTNRVNVTIAGSATAESGAFVKATSTLNMAAADSGLSAPAQDGDNSVTIGNADFNVVLGAFEPAGAFNSGVDAFQRGADNAGYEGGLRARSSNNIGLNVTSIEGVSLQISTDVDNQDDVRVVAGTTFGGVAVTAGLASSDDNSAAGFGLTAGTTVGDVALNVSYAKADNDDSSFNVNATYAGFTLAMQNDNDESATDKTEQEVYGAYVISDAAGLAGLNVTIGAGTSDSVTTTEEDTKYGVRVEYSF
jgi:hypothetical protein